MVSLLVYFKEVGIEGSAGSFSNIIECAKYWRKGDNKIAFFVTSDLIGVKDVAIEMLGADSVFFFDIKPAGRKLLALCSILKDQMNLIIEI